MIVPEVKVEEGESLDSALKRFKRECQQEGILSEIKRREYYEKPSERRKRLKRKR
jgi:small subunit ribosomal protein S21